MQEIGMLKGQIEQSQKDNASYGQLERKYESLTTEMRTLQVSAASKGACNPTVKCLCIGKSTLST